MRCCVLLVEPDPTLRKYLSDLVRRRGHSCTVVASVAEALRELRERTYPTIIADLDLAGDDAGGLAEQLRLACPGAWLVALQSTAEQPDATPSDVAFDTVIAKPFVADPLLAILPPLSGPQTERAEA